jgi:hypothetical protein
MIPSTVSLSFEPAGSPPRVAHIPYDVTARLAAAGPLLWNRGVRLLASVLLLALLLGRLLGGRLRALADARLRWWPAIPVALLMQVAPAPREIADGLLAFGLLLASYALLIVVVARNWRLLGFPVILVGLVLNGAVIGVNAGMPVSGEAIRRSGNLSLFQDLPRERVGKHHLASDQDRLMPLTDVIPVPLPIGSVISAGDVLIDVGAAAFLVAAMLGRPEIRRRASAARGRTATRSGTPP